MMLCERILTYNAGTNEVIVFRRTWTRAVDVMLTMLTLVPIIQSRTNRIKIQIHCNEAQSNVV